MATPLGWYSDPTGRFLYRYWDGASWTEQVSNGGAHSGTDPNLLPADVLTTPPAPGTEAPGPSTPAPQVVVTETRSSSAGTTIALLVAAAAIIILIFVLVSNSGGDDGAPADDNPPATEAPAPEEGS